MTSLRVVLAFSLKGRNNGLIQVKDRVIVVLAFSLKGRNNYTPVRLHPSGVVLAFSLKGRNNSKYSFPKDIRLY